MTPAPDHDDDNTLAGEYVLHVMDADQRRAFDRRLADDPALRALVADWDAQLSPLADGFIAQTPPASVKTRIDARLFAEPEPQHSWSLWRVLAGSGLVAALIMAVLVLIPQGPALFTPSLTARITAADASLVVQARFAPDTGVLRIDRLTAVAATDRVQELWLIAGGTAAPVSLGVLPAAQQTDITLPAALIPAIAGGTLAISDEPPGGSPTGTPTGEILAVGILTAI